MYTSEIIQPRDIYLTSQIDTTSRSGSSVSSPEPTYPDMKVEDIPNYDFVAPYGYYFDQQTNPLSPEHGDATNSTRSVITAKSTVSPDSSTIDSQPGIIPSSLFPQNSYLVDGACGLAVYSAGVQGPIGYYPDFTIQPSCDCPACTPYDNCYTRPFIQELKQTWDRVPAPPYMTTLDVSLPSTESSPLGTPELSDQYQSSQACQTIETKCHNYYSPDPLDPDNDAAWGLCPGTGEHLRQSFNLPPGPLNLDMLPDSDDPYDKPPVRYEILVAVAIYGSEYKRLSLQAIYNVISEKYAYFRNPENVSWKNSIRHLLSLYGMFVPREKEACDDQNSKGGVWTLDPCCNPKYTRVRKRRAKKSKKSSLDSPLSEDSSSDSEYSGSTSASSAWSTKSRTSSTVAVRRSTRTKRYPDDTDETSTGRCSSTRTAQNGSSITSISASSVSTISPSQMHLPIRTARERRTTKPYTRQTRNGHRV
ncbi:transcription factor [Stygiomarasmius scandens]|uniref:Transcription factor n=1 Tax=Marasmiellus scandens TaxID=2682957 RepID=A0ABR1J4C6_9AGAR